MDIQSNKSHLFFIEIDFKVEKHYLNRLHISEFCSTAIDINVCQKFIFRDAHFKSLENIFRIISLKNWVCTLIRFLLFL